jgi:hypothetical protein
MMSEWWRRDEVHLLACDRMLEPDFCSMEHEPLALGAIELVAYDGTSEAVGVGTVYAQLMGTTCLRI